MRICQCAVLLCLTVALCEAAAQAAPPTKQAAVRVSASRTKVQQLSSVTFTARIRPDVAATMHPADQRGDPFLFEPHIIGWLWVPDLDGIDPWTKACASPELTCTTLIHGSGTMVFSIRTRDQLCADWVHVDAVNVPDIDDGRDSLPRLRSDSIMMAVKTKAPTWTRCTS